MASVFLLLVAACVSAVVGRGLEVQNEYCSTALYGTKTYIYLDLHPVTIPPGVRDWTLQIPNNCAYGEKVGELVTACDYDSPPVITSADVGQLIFIHRTGHLAGSGIVKVRIYCTILENNSENKYQGGSVLAVPN